MSFISKLSNNLRVFVLLFHPYSQYKIYFLNIDLILHLNAQNKPNQIKYFKFSGKT